MDRQMDRKEEVKLEKLWRPDNAKKEASQMVRFLHYLKEEGKLELEPSLPHLSLLHEQYQKLHRWSVEKKDDFWSSLFPFFEVIYEGDLRPAFRAADEENSKNPFLDNAWFPKVRLNFAENLLRPVLPVSQGMEEKVANKVLDKQALIGLHESGMKRGMTYQELLRQVTQFQHYLDQILGVDGDTTPVLAAYMPNIPETVVSMLAIAAKGGIFTSTSADFGVQGVIDRFGQISPEVLVAATGYTYNGKYLDQTEKIKEIQRQLPSLKKIVLVDFLGKFAGPAWEGAVLWTDIFRKGKNVQGEQEDFMPTFKRVPFSAPLYIMYSSGTTGKPKCIVHSVGGTLLQHLKELGLHTNLTSDRNIFYFTTCGWMMWNWLVSSLAFGATVGLYEGSPSHPDMGALFKLINEERFHIFGTSPKFLRALEVALKEGKAQLPEEFPSLETILSTGAPLLPDQFDFVYARIKKDVQLSSICGGTDIIGCFMLGNPLLPVYRGEIQCLGLGMDVAAWREREEGKPEEVVDEEGELVCKTPFPSCPVGFWGDDERKTLFRKAYFEHFPGVWHHGDFVRLSSQGTVRVFGRSDATLNPGGVRIGTAEIYQQTEIWPFVADALCVSKGTGDDVEVVLFIKMKEGESLTEERIRTIKEQIRRSTTPRHVPAHIHSVKDIPYTRSGKKMELLVSRVLNRRPLTNLEAVANPECLKEYEEFV